jgi:hypothetical protein
MVTGTLIVSSKRSPGSALDFLEDKTGSFEIRSQVIFIDTKARPIDIFPNLEK